jgi:HEAT repeat protein
MDLAAIRAAVASGDTIQRVRALAALRPYEPAECVPLMLECLGDAVFLVRSLACMGLGYKRSPEGRAALLTVIELEEDPNVRAEAANALARHGGAEAVQPLLALYERDQHWLVRRSILAALGTEPGVPEEVLVALAERALADGDSTLKQIRLEQLLKPESC